MSEYVTIAGRSIAEIEEKKSRFIAHLAHVESEEEALSFLEEIRTEHRMARHNVYAYILRGEGASERIRYSDDGEPQKTAGLPTQSAIAESERVTVSVCVDITLRIAYPLYDQMVRIAAECNAKTLDTQYADAVTLTLRMLDGTQNPFLAKVTELCHGQEDIEISKPLNAIF